MGCKYIFQEGDEAVTKGIVKVGDACGNANYTKEYEIYDKETPDVKYKKVLCRGHYNSWRASVNKSDFKDEVAKRQETVSNQKEAAVERHDKIVTESGKNPSKFGISPEILDAMGLKEQRSLEDELALYKALNLGEGQENYDEKMAYARWLSTPEPHRKPRTIDEVAQILGVTKFTLEMWRRSPEIVKFKARNAEMMLENAYQFVAYKALEGCARGDARFFEVYRKMRADVIDKAPKSKFPDLPEHLLKLAESRHEESGRKKFDSSLKEAERNAVFGSVRDGDIKVGM